MRAALIALALVLAGCGGATNEAAPAKAAGAAQKKAPGVRPVERRAQHVHPEGPPAGSAERLHPLVRGVEQRPLLGERGRRQLALPRVPLAIGGGVIGD